MKKSIALGLLIVSVLAGGLFQFATRAKTVNGAEFQSIVLESDKNSSSSWRLYLEDQLRYCLELSAIPFSKRYCVSKEELAVRNRRDGGSEIGYVRENQFHLKVTRGRDVIEESF